MDHRRFHHWNMGYMKTSNQSMKPTAPLRCNFRTVATAPCRGLISFSLDLMLTQNQNVRSLPYFLIFLLLGLTSFPMRAETLNPPPCVAQGLELAKYGGLLSAIDFWAQFPPLNQNYSPEDRLKNSRTIERLQAGFGPVKSHSILAIDEINSQQKTVWVALYYQRGVFYLRLQCYRSPEDWVVTEFSYGSNPHKLLPESLLLQLR